APVYGWVLLISAAAIPFALTALLLQSLLLGIQEIRAYNKIDASTAAVSFAMIALLVWAGSVRVDALMAVTLLVAATGLGWTAAELRRRTPALGAPSWPLLRTSLRYGARAYLAALFAFLAQRGDLLIVNRVLGSEQAGYYAVAANVAAIVCVFPSVVGTVLFPRLSAVSDARERWRITKRVIGLVAVLVTLFSGCFALVAPALIRLAFGATFEPAITPFYWLLPGIVLLSVNMILMNYFASIGHPPFSVYAWAAAAGVNILLNAVFVPRFGISGAAVVSTLTYSVLVLSCAVYAAHSVPGRRKAS
ncbi:MAG: oligosaccharide flippase family protein, partial [Gemmatimonadetes bacterium]|nr:oligosaccharide flippase family protein [Gemmatimonadota bacterium]